VPNRTAEEDSNEAWRRMEKNGEEWRRMEKNSEISLIHCEVSYGSKSIL
jgi:hypothetical protein